MKQNLFIFICICAIVMFSFSSPVFSSGGTDGSLDIEIHTGPEFTGQDNQTIKACTKNYYWDFFPMDFLFNGPSISSGSGECPSVTFFGHYEEFCWALNTYRLISPGITLSLFAYAIFNL